MIEERDQRIQKADFWAALVVVLVAMHVLCELQKICSCGVDERETE